MSDSASRHIEIEGAGGQSRRYDADSLMVAMAGDYAGHKPLDLGMPGPASVISGEPGFIYRNGSVEIALTRRELQHLVFNALPPAWYLRLREHSGDFPEIGPDLYDPHNGRALQAKVKIPRED
ncbi:MAG: hypothetical protein ABR558_00165 [Thioalkalivibrio sp.]